MLNSEKFKTAEERGKAFDKWCHTRGGCDMCILHDAGIELQTCVCSFYWLDLETEAEKPLPCPCCGGECVVESHSEGHNVRCCSRYCYIGKTFESRDKAIATHNRVARSAMAEWKKEGK